MYKSVEYTVFKKVWQTDRHTGIVIHRGAPPLQSYHTGSEALHDGIFSVQKKYFNLTGKCPRFEQGNTLPLAWKRIEINFQKLNCQNIKLLSAKR